MALNLPCTFFVCESNIPCNNALIWSSERLQLIIEHLKSSVCTGFPSKIMYMMMSRSWPNGCYKSPNPINLSSLVIERRIVLITALFRLCLDYIIYLILFSGCLSFQVDYNEAIFLWHVDKKDFVLWIITSTTTLFLGIEIGVLVGVSI